jgi:tetratricopeptide (TPR) repeat protein
MEMLMRLTPIALSLGIALATMASAGYGQKPDDVIDPRSLAVAAEAQTALGAAKFGDAIDLYETALAVDPRNRQAYVGLARVAQAQKLPGKAIRFYTEALKLEPNDVGAIAGQGEAYVQRGAVERARRNLEKLKTLCAAPCTQATTLAAAIAKGPPAEVLTAQAPVTVVPPAPETPKAN